MNQTFFIADLHLGHKRIIEFEAASRPFSSIEEHDQALIDGWNSKVGKRDSVWVLGDVAMGHEALAKIGFLRGFKKLVLGNHDRYRMSEYERYFTKVYGSAKLHDFALTHIPIHPNQSHRFKGNIHGHMHSKKLDDPWYYCVSVEQLPVFGQPVSLDELISKSPAFPADSTGQE